MGLWIFFGIGHLEVQALGLHQFGLQMKRAVAKLSALSLSKCIISNQTVEYVLRQAQDEGVVVHLVERFICNEEVASSSLADSTIS